MFQNRQIGRAFSVHMHDGSLLGVAIGNFGNVAQQNGSGSYDLNGDAAEPGDRIRTGIELHAVISPADARVSGGKNHIRALQRSDHVSG